MTIATFPAHTGAQEQAVAQVLPALWTALDEGFASVPWFGDSASIAASKANLTRLGVLLNELENASSGTGYKPVDGDLYQVRNGFRPFSWWVDKANLIHDGIAAQTGYAQEWPLRKVLAATLAQTAADVKAGAGQVVAALPAVGVGAAVVLLVVLAIVVLK